MAAGKDYHRSYYYKRRQKILDYLGGRCVICGSTDQLEIDHIDPNQKSFDIKKNLTLDTIIDEVNKCQLLCKSCHLTKTIAEQATYKHGTLYAWMKRKCQCDVCKLAKRTWHDKRNESRRLQTDKSRKRGPYQKNPDHGTTARYHRGCRCDHCMKAKADYERERRKKS